MSYNLKQKNLDVIFFFQRKYKKLLEKVLIKRKFNLGVSIYHLF